MTYTGFSGFVHGPHPANIPAVCCAANLDMSGILPAGQPGNIFTSDGQLLIGSTAATAGGTHTRIGNITSTDGSIAITNGSGTINLAGAAQGFQPNAVLQLFDEFLSHGAVSNPGQLLWTGYQSNTPSMDITTSINHPGVVTVSDSPKGGLYLSNQTLATMIKLGGGAISLSYVFDLVALSTAGNRYAFYIGLSDDENGNGALNIANGVYFSYSDNVNSGNWVLNCTSASVTTSVNTAIPATTGFHTFTMNINAGATSVSFFLDNALIGTAITTNIPTTVLSLFFFLLRSSGALPASQIDLMWFTQSLSNPRPGPVSPAISGNSGRLIENYTQTGISYSVLGTDAIIGVSSTAAPRTITMPNASVTTGQRWTIKDESGGAATNNITISGNGYLIDGAATSVMNINYGAVDIYFNGSAYYII